MQQGRFVSLTFDDGLLSGARKAVKVLEPYGARATFYLVTGWVRPHCWRIRDPWNMGRDHGSWEDWQEIEAYGHEIGSHTVSHRNASGRKARWIPWLLRWEMQASYAHLRRYLRQPPVSIAMPWNAMTSTAERLARQTYHAARIGQSRVQYNHLARLNWYRLASWAPETTVPVADICQRIAEIPPAHWLILQFHSLDDEGYMPLTGARLEAIVRYIASSAGVYQVTVRDMVARFKSCDTEGAG